MRYAIESWSPEYGSPVDLQSDPDRTPPEVQLDVEFPQTAWRSVTTDSGPAESVLFIDGVRRIEARLWAFDADDMPSPGIVTSYAAGVVRCDGATAVIERQIVERTVFGQPGLPTIVTHCARYEPHAVIRPAVDALLLALQERLGRLERQVADDARGADFIVIDGPLSGRENVPGAIGYVKSHETAYLPAELAKVVSGLQPGERTPVFLTRTSWSRYSWYVRLPGGSGHPWAGIVRCEAAPDLPLAEVFARADLSATTLPRYASAPHKEPRAPQNLYPVGALERDLRRRLGDETLLYRALRLAASDAVLMVE